jgi:Fur family ferric uptake transcriptional regulator
VTGRADDWGRLLRERGYRLTPQRELVLDAVQELGHATPEQVLAHVRRTSRSVNLSTVYRTLDVLQELGLVSHAHLDHGAPTYHSTSAPQHVHLVCGGCGTVVEAQPAIADEIVAAARAQHGFAVDVAHLAVSGRCRDCDSQDVG